MLFRNRPPDVDFHVFIENEIIDILNWNHHIHTVRSNLSKFAAIIYRASCLINMDGIGNVCCTAPYFCTSVETWAVNKAQLKKLDVAEMRIYVNYTNIYMSRDGWLVPERLGSIAGFAQ